MHQRHVEQRGGQIVITLSLQIKRIDGRRMLVSPEGRDLVVPSVPEPHEAIVKALGMAYHWQAELLTSGRSTAQLSADIGFSESRIKTLLTLTNLSPQILRQALVGTLPSTVTLGALLAASRRLDWSAQAIALGLGTAA